MRDDGKPKLFYDFYPRDYKEQVVRSFAAGIGKQLYALEECTFS